MLVFVLCHWSMGLHCMHAVHCSIYILCEVQLRLSCQNSPKFSGLLPGYRRLSLRIFRTIRLIFLALCTFYGSSLFQWGGVSILTWGLWGRLSLLCCCCCLTSVVMQPVVGGLHNAMYTIASSLSTGYLMLATALC